MNNEKEEDQENIITKNTIWVKVLYLVFFIIIAVICYNIYLYWFDNSSNNIKITISDVTEIEVPSIEVEVPRIEVEVPNIDNNLIEIDTIIDDIPNDTTLRLIKEENILGLNKINELFDSFE